MPVKILLVIVLLLTAWITALSQNLTDGINTKDSILSEDSTTCEVKVFDTAFVDYQHQPSYTGGISEMLSFFRNNLRLPRCCQCSNKTVYVAFKVDSLGILHHIQLIDYQPQHVYPAEEHVALELVKKMPAWIPASVKGKAIDSWTMIPIRFKYIGTAP